MIRFKRTRSATTGGQSGGQTSSQADGQPGGTASTAGTAVATDALTAALANEASEPSLEASLGLDDDPVRARINALGSRLSLPTVRRALGVLEGEHPSGQRGSGYEFLDERYYDPSDEARFIDWKATARRGRPVVVDKERTVTSKVWMLLDGGSEMTGITPTGEKEYRVAFNAMRMFAMLSMRRGDDVEVVSVNSQGAVKAPVANRPVDFDRALRHISRRIGTAPRSMKDLVRFAKRIPDRRCLIVIVSDETGWSQVNPAVIKTLRRTHQVTAVCVKALNPFAVAQSPIGVFDARTDRRVPAYLRTQADETELATHRTYMDTKLHDTLERAGATYISATSSEAMFSEFVDMLSVTMRKRDVARGVPRAGSRAGSRTTTSATAAVTAATAAAARGVR
ncbi:MAG: DUF58 domain-containing protein [Bifidobacteriaceae bacterium]|nr:DUF58 domain-containing protein [Bifidobacteriaceae bacterium]